MSLLDRSNIVKASICWMAMLDAQLNIPTLLASILWMAMLEAQLNVRTLLASICWIAMLDAQLNIPTLLASICLMAMLDAQLNIPTLLASICRPDGNVGCSAKHSNIVGQHLPWVTEVCLAQFRSRSMSLL